jgi:dTDP-glucose 4,6-dehydratase
MNPLAQDLDHVLAHTEGLWDELRGQRIFITGGTGFFGCWLLESFLWANDKLGLGASATVLTRNPDAFRQKAPHLAGHPNVRLHIGDVRSCQFPDGQFSHIIHAVGDSSTGLDRADALDILDTIIEGTRRTLDFAAACGAGKLLMTSSGAVYGEQPSDLTHMPETYAGAPDTMDVRAAYGESKRIAELLCAIYHQKYGIETMIARCFACVGPYLPLDIYYAIGNFMRDALQGGPIRVKGDGTPHRSFLYAADLMIWLWTILMKGEACRPYNVGSEQDFTIAQAAETVSGAAGGGIAVEIPAVAPDNGLRRRYVPATSKARAELHVPEGVPLSEAIQRTLLWLAPARGGERSSHE